jgi:uncharacterized protein (TIGR02145 family)
MALMLTACKKEKSVFAVAEFSFSGNVSATLPATVQFTNKSIGLSYTWDFGDGSSSVEDNPRHIYNQYGIYRVKLTARGTNNVDSLIVDVVIGGTLGQITALNCASAQVNRTIKTGDVLNQHPVLVPYTGGNGGVYNGQSVTSTGVTGLTATLTAGTLASGAGNLEYKLTGTPQAFGQAKFNLNVGGRNCELSIAVLDSGAPIYPPNTVHCDPNNPTVINEVLNPITGRIWMDRNLGANRVATSSTDVQAYGDLYQWGRRADGHQCRNSATRNVLSSIDQPLHGDFITSGSDWRNPNNNNLWQGLHGINNPCPTGFRVPTWVELELERSGWNSNNAVGAYNAVLRFTAAGRRNGGGGFEDVGKDGGYWTSSVSLVSNQNLSRRLAFNEIVSFVDDIQRVRGFSIRCIKN